MKRWEKGFFMNQKDLLYIKTIVDEGGITPAAKKLFVSQPSLSQSLKRIEDALGTPLFRRTPRGLVLTDAGTQYYRMTQTVLKVYEGFEEEIQNMEELKSGTVVVGTTPHRGLFLFPEFLAEFYLKYPGIQVKVVEQPVHELEELLLAGKVDFAMFRELPGDSTYLGTFESLGLSKEEFMILLPEGHPAGKYAEYREDLSYPILDPKWLADENFLLPDPDMRLYETILAILRNAGIERPKCSFHSMYLETFVPLTAAGAGVAIVSRRLMQRYEGKKGFEQFLLPESYGTFWEVSLVMLKDSYLSKADSKFIEEFKKYIEYKKQDEECG